MWRRLKAGLLSDEWNGGGMLGWRAWDPGAACSRTDATMQQSSNNDTSHDDQTSLISNTIRTPRWPSRRAACPQEILRPLASWCELVHHPRGSFSTLYSGEPYVEESPNIRHCLVASCRRGLSYPPDGCSLAGSIMVIGAEFTGRAAVQRRQSTGSCPSRITATRIMSTGAHSIITQSFTQ